MRGLPAALITGWTRRRSANVGTLILAVANAAISYDALAAAARDAGLPWVLSWLFPLATDGIIAVATPAQLELRERNAPTWARAQIGFLLWAAIVFSVVGNASRAAVLWSGADFYGVPLPSWPAVWLALPPLAYAGALHVLGLVHRYPDPSRTDEDDEARQRAALDEAERALAEARGESARLARALDEARRSTPPPAGRAKPTGKGAPSARGQRADTSARRAPNGSRADQMRALLASPGGRELTGDELGARLGIDAGYARRLRAEVERADDGPEPEWTPGAVAAVTRALLGQSDDRESAPALALVGADSAPDDGAPRTRQELTDTAVAPGASATAQEA